MATNDRYRRHVSQHGAFWTADGCSSTVLRRSLQKDAETDAFVKSAAIGSGTEGEFERSFASLAYAYMKDRAPKLLDYLVGFQLLDRADDNNKAAGVFGFYAGKHWYYVPVFFLNRDLKGYELLYVKDEDVVVPCKENWVSYMLQRGPHNLITDDEDPIRHIRHPDLRPLISSPSRAKFSCDQFFQDGLPWWASCATKSASFLYPGVSPHTKLNMDQVCQDPYAAALATTPLDMNRILPERFPLLKAAWDLARSSPEIYRGFRKFYGINCFERWAKQADVLDPGGSWAFSAPRRAPASGWIDKLAEKKAALQIFLYENERSEPNSALEWSDKDRLAKKRYLIKDKREDFEVSEAYVVRHPMKLANPSSSGIYNILSPDGSTWKGLVLPSPASQSGSCREAVVIDLDGSLDVGESKSEGGDPKPSFEEKTQGTKGKSSTMASPKKIWAEIDPADTGHDWFEKIKGGKESLSENNSYVAVHERGAATAPFTVDRKLAEGVYRVSFHPGGGGYGCCPPSCGGGVAGDATDPQAHEPVQLRTDNGVSDYSTKLHVRKGGHSITVTSVGVVVPEDCKFIQIRPYEDKIQKYLGTPDSVHRAIVEKTSRLKLSDDHDEICISTDGLKPWKLSPHAAVVSLVRDFGFREKSALAMLGDLAKSGVANYRVKYAAGYGPLAPPLPPDYYTTEQVGRRAVPALYPHESSQPVEALSSANTTDPNTYDPWQKYTKEDFEAVKQQAQTASAKGNKELFDVGAFASVLRSVDPSTWFNKDIGHLMRAMDSLGRELMMVYYHYEDFQERYGRQEMPELEEGLRNAFNALGDITLFVRKKSVNPSMAGESAPDIQQLAHA